MKLTVIQPGMLTTVQDLGRWGHQAIGMPVAGAMDPMALRRGNIMVNNDQGEAALEITVMGPRLSVEGEGIIALTGADLGLTINGEAKPVWTSHKVSNGDIISFSGMKGHGCRSCLCVGGGIDVPPLMGSRSTYMRGKIGGLEGRPLRAGDVLPCGEPRRLWKRAAGFTCPEELRPDYSPDRELSVVMGPQDSSFTEAGIETFTSSTYTISSSADRMGYRLEGPEVEHTGSADIVSDAICLGAIQIPGHGQPIAMMADRQTTGGYTKIAVLTSTDVALMSQRLPGHTVKFRAISQEEAVMTARREAEAVESVRLAREAWIARNTQKCNSMETADSGSCSMKVNGEKFQVQWQRV